jgi:hypothetical protein
LENGSLEPKTNAWQYVESDLLLLARLYGFAAMLEAGTCRAELKLRNTLLHEDASKGT